MLTSLFSAELFKLARRAMPRILLLILAGGVVLFYLLMLLALRSTESANGDTQDLDDLRRSVSPAYVREFGLGLVTFLGSILVVILSVSLMSSEFSWGTIRTILPRAGSRVNFLTAKYLLIALFVLVAVALGWLASVLGSVLISTIEDIDLGFGDNALVENVAAIARSAYVMLPYAALAFLIAVLTRSTAAGIAIGLVILFGESIATPLINLLGDPFDRIPDALISRNVDAVMSAGTPPDGAAADSDGPRAWRGAGVLALWTAAFVALAYVIFLRRDVTSGGE